MGRALAPDQPASLTTPPSPKNLAQTSAGCPTDFDPFFQSFRAFSEFLLTFRV
jgi:hypothetical protein